MAGLRIVIIEDEKRIRRSLIHVLKLYCPEVEVAGEAESVESGLEVIKAQGPDVVLLDIKMPDGTGFDILTRLNPLNFKVIFITAFDQHAVQAFKFSAIDYLLKPVVPDELVSALKRAGAQINAETSNAQLDAFMENIKELANEKKKLVLNSQDKTHVVAVKDIISCDADGNYTKFNLVAKKEVFVSRQLGEFEEILVPYGFFRSHHSHLINLAWIDRIEKGESKVIMKDGSSVLLAARKHADLTAALSRI